MNLENKRHEFIPIPILIPIITIITITISIPELGQCIN